MNTNYQPINFKEKLTLFSEFWTPKIVGRFDNNYIKLAKMKGDFVWHSHEDCDEMFLVVSGSVTILFRDGEVVLQEGECYIVPRGTEHKPVAEQEAHCLIVEKAGTINTGDQPGKNTVENEEWI